MKHTAEPLQGGGKGNNQQRLWAHLPGGAIIIADFGVSASLRDETKEANARRARAAWNACQGVSTEQLETFVRHGCKVEDLMRVFVRLSAEHGKLVSALDTTMQEAIVILRCIGHTELFQGPGT